MLVLRSPIVVAQESTLEDLELVDHHGQPFQMQQLKGQVVMLFFGYTSCPDVCPLELSMMSRVLNRLEIHEPRLRGVFVSVDHERDTPQRLKEYVAHFSDKLLGLTGSPEQLKQVAGHFNVGYKVLASDSEGGRVRHSSNLLVLDDQARIHALVPFGMDADHISRVVENLLDS